MHNPTSWYSSIWVWFSFTRAEYSESVNCVCGVNWWNSQLNCVRLKHICITTTTYTVKKKNHAMDKFHHFDYNLQNLEHFFSREFRRHIGQTPGQFFLLSDPHYRLEITSFSHISCIFTFVLCRIFHLISLIVRLFSLAFSLIQIYPEWFSIDMPVTVN